MKKALNEPVAKDLKDDPLNEFERLSDHRNVPYHRPARLTKNKVNRRSSSYEKT